MEPAFAHDSERLVWDRVRAGLPGDAILLANVNLVAIDRDHEADLVVLLPMIGVVVLEVKGGSVFHENGTWRQGNRQGSHPIRPVDQARNAMYAIRNYVERDPRWGSRGPIGWAHGVVTPFSAFGDDFETADCKRWMLHDKRDLNQIEVRLETNAINGGKNQRPPTHDDLELIAQILCGKGFTQHDLNAEVEERQARADRLTNEQLALLRVTRLLNRVEVRGGAGTGKTVLALAQAKELGAGRDERTPQRVALLCYSIGLAEFLRRQVEAWPRRQRPAFVGTYEELGRLWGAPEGDREDSGFWEDTLPRLMASLADELPDGHRFDSIVVDEAQDFAEGWWAPLIKSLRDQEDGGLYIYSDENQRIFGRFGRPPVSLVPLVLDDNLRNTKQIHHSFAPLAPTRMAAKGSDGPDVMFIPSDDPVDAADDAIEILTDVGLDLGKIALLTTGKRHTEHVNRVEALGLRGYWQTFWDDDVFYGHVLGFKGLERPAVVLCVNETLPHARSRERFYVGMSRATDHLIVVGRPDLVRDIAGPEVAARLGIN